MVPVGSALLYVELVAKGFSRFYTGKVLTDVWDAIHSGGQDQAVPMDRTVLGEVIGYIQRDALALFPAQNRRRYAAVYRGRKPTLAGIVDWLVTKGQFERIAGKHRLALF